MTTPMRKSYWFSFIIPIFLAIAAFFTFATNDTFAEEQSPYNFIYNETQSEDEIHLENYKTQNSLNLSENGSILYVANTQEDCGTLVPCFPNTGSAATGLQDAISAANPGDRIIILEDYTIRDNTILVDKNLVIEGHENSSITYNGNNCNNPMLRFTAGGTLQDLTIKGGDCNGASRDLIEIASDSDTFIVHNTLSSGNQAIYVENTTGLVTIAFNHITENLDYAIVKASGTNTDETQIYANNIHNNRSGYQVNCNNRGTANHNYWGEGVLATSSAINCTVSNRKRLGSPILLRTDRAGVEATRINVTETITYAFNNQIGVSRSAGEDYDVIIVNHGQGESLNIPFYLTGAGAIQPCSNFYDVFLAEDTSPPSNLILALKYDLNTTCINTIESSTYCGQPDKSQQYPLWWYDPSDTITNGWDRTGQSPQGPGAEGDIGQETSCNLDNKEIVVIIDDTGRPGISTDLNYTPFVVGLPIISDFSGSFSVDRISLRWSTISEVDIQGFYVLRSDTATGPYSRISSLIPALGDANTGKSYDFTDSNITLNRIYYYKIEVINERGTSIKMTDPLQMLSTLVTPTFTPTPTSEPPHFPTRTATLYYFNSPTPFPPPNTPTPLGPPTQVRTYGPTPTGTRTFIIKPPEDTATPDPNTGYPVNTVTITPSPSYTPTLDNNGQVATPTLRLEPTPEPDPPVNDQQTPPIGNDLEPDHKSPLVSWLFLGVGIATGLGLLATTSLILAISKKP